MFDPATAVIAGGSVLGGALGLWGSSQQADAAKSAAQTQSQAAKDAADLQWKEFLIAQQASQPWQQAGASALDKLNLLLGTTTDPGALGDMPVGPGDKPVLSNYQKAYGWSQDTTDAYGYGRDVLAKIAYNKDMRDWNVKNEQYQSDLTAWNDKKAAIDKYNTAKSDPSYGSLLKPFEWDTSNPDAQDPGYTFRLGQGLKALNASAAARGGFFSGQTAQDLTNYGQDYASAEYANAYNRDLQSRQNAYNNLATLAGLGQNASTTIGTMGMNTASNAGNLSLSAAQALAQGQLGAGNAAYNGLGSINNALMSGIGNLTQYQLLKNYLS